MILGHSLIGIFDPRWSFVMFILLIVAIVAVALFIERFIFYFSQKVDTDAYFKKVRETFKTGGITEVLALTKKDDHPQSHIVRTAFENYDLPEDMLAEMCESSVLEQRMRLEKFQGGIGTIGYVSPLLGLLGTVIGLIRAFHAIAVTGSGGPAVVSSGIAEALLTTAVGLIVAVPVIWGYNYLSKKSADIVDELESLMRKLLYMIVTSKGGRYEAAKTGS